MVLDGIVVPDRSGAKQRGKLWRPTVTDNRSEFPVAVNMTPTKFNGNRYSFSGFLVAAQAAPVIPVGGDSLMESVVTRLRRLS